MTRFWYFGRNVYTGCSYPWRYASFFQHSGLFTEIISHYPNSWDYPRRVVCKIEKPFGQMIHMNTFVVTNMDSSPEELIRFYCKRGQMENFIKECKSGFDMDYVSSSSQIVNANRIQIHALAYILFNWFRRLVLPTKLRNDRVDTLRLKLMKIAARIVRSSRYILFKLCSSCPFQHEFFETLHNIRQLQPISN